MEEKDECSNLLPSAQEKYVQSLESRLLERSNRLEEKHMEAAIDAELISAPCCCVATAVSRQNKNTNDNVEPKDSSNTSTPDDGDDHHEKKKKKPIFDDYTNPDSVQNCLSPYVPTSAARIAALVQFVKLQKDDVFLDIGSGDGRVCIAASQLTTMTTVGGGGCRAIGLDVSPLCIQMAQQVALEEGLADHVEFYQTDATVDPQVLLSGSDNDDDSSSSLLSKALKSATVVYLYTYPTLLLRLTPLLSQLVQHHKVRAIVTLTYHLPESIAKPDAVNVEHNFRLYTKLSLSS